jgi:hypothetical protein
MKLYLGYYSKEVNEKADNPPIGLILSEEKDDIIVEYAMLNDSSKLVVSKYQLYLPNIDQLKRRVKEIIEKQKKLILESIITFFFKGLTYRPIAKQ